MPKINSSKTIPGQLLLAIGALCIGTLLQACGGAPTASPATSLPASAHPVESSPPAASPVNANSAAKPGVPRLKVAYLSLGVSFAPLWMAKEIGAFEKYGVAVDLEYMEPSVALPAIISRSIDVIEESGPSIPSADANGNEDLVFIAAGVNHAAIGLYTAASITTAEQLRGKVVATDKPGTGTDYGLRVALSLLGLKPADVQALTVGPPPVVLQAMLSGQVPAGVLAVPQRFQAEAKGFRLLQDTTSLPYQNIGLVAKRSRLDGLGPALRPLLAAYRDGMLAWNSQPDLATKVLDKYAKVDDPQILRQTYEFNRNLAPFEPSLQPTTEGLQAIIDFLASTNVPALKGARAEQFIDTRFLSDLPRS